MTLQAHPGLMAASLPWLSGVDYKRTVTWIPYTAIVLVLTRDKGSGRVTIGRDGLPRIRYWPDAHDRGSMLKVGFWGISGFDAVLAAIPRRRMHRHHLTRVLLSVVTGTCEE